MRASYFFALLGCLCFLAGCPADDDDSASSDDDTGDDDVVDDDTSSDDDSGLTDCLYYRDADGDGYGDPIEEMLESCDGPPDGYVANNEDCNDGDPEIHPAAEELCDGLDNNCDGVEDEDLPLYECHTDGDGDGYGEIGGLVAIQCECGPGSSPEGTDCDDSNPDVYAGAPDVCDDVLDNDCDGATDPMEGDDDLDGFAECQGDCDDSDSWVNPRAEETCDAQDNDCDGVADDDCLNCTISVPGDYSVIQDALDSVVAGDTICVEPGMYNENLDFGGVAGTLVGIAGPLLTVVDGGGFDTVVRFDDEEGPDSVLRGFTITNGYTATNGGGLYMSYASPALSNLIVTGNEADNGGGGYLSYSSPTMNEVIIEGNIVSTDGGGLFLNVSDPVLSGVVISGNEAPIYGGGILLWGASAPILDNVVISGNTTSGDGGGIAVLNYSTMTVTNSLISSNEASRGGGIRMNGSSSSLTNVVFAGN